MQLTVATHDDRVVSVDVDASESVENVKAILEVEVGVPLAQQRLIFNNQELQNSAGLSTCGVKDGDVVMLVPGGAPSASGGAEAGTRGAAASSTNPMRLASDGSAVDPQLFIDTVKANPAILGQLHSQMPDIANAVLSGSPETLQEALRKHRRVHSERAVAEKKRQAELYARLARDPFDIEAQKEIEESIRQSNVDENMAMAMEYRPEAFGHVHMLYVEMEVNGHKLKAFVDSGAQSTIMSAKCAERTGIMRLLDTRFAGVAMGVGSGKILGKVHSVPIKVGEHNLLCSFTILEQDGVEFLFGLDMLKSFQCCIDLQANRLKFGSINESIRFLDEHEIPKSEMFSAAAKEKQAAAEGASAGSASATVPPPAAQQQQAAQKQQGPPAGSTHFPEEKIAALTALGFSRELALQALELCNGSEEQAASYLFSAM